MYLCRTQTHLPKKSLSHNSRGCCHIEHSATLTPKLSERDLSPKTASLREKLTQNVGPQAVEAQGNMPEQGDHNRGNQSPLWEVGVLQLRKYLGLITQPLWFP